MHVPPPLIVPVDTSALGKRLYQGFPLPQDLWQLKFVIEMEYDQNRHSKSYANLLFQSYGFRDKSLLLVLKRQIDPAYTWVSYSQGLFFKTYHTDVRLMMCKKPDSEVNAYYQKLLGEWRVKYPKLSEQKKRKYKNLPFFFDESNIEGLFYFLMDQKGNIPLKNLAKEGIWLNQVKSRRPWQKIGEKPVSYHPNTFQSLFHGLKLFSSLKESKKTTWKIEDATTVDSMLKFVIQLHPSLIFALPAKSEKSFSISCEKKQKGETIVFAKSFKDPELGGGFSLKKYLRRRVFSSEKTLQKDHILIEVGGEEKSIKFSILLQKYDENDHTLSENRKIH